MTNCNNSDAQNHQRFPKLSAGTFLRVLLIAAVVALICIAIFVSVGTVRLSQAGVHLALSLVYSIFIALPSMLLLNWIGFRYTFYDAFNPAARQLYWSQINTNLFNKGVDAWWEDATEPDVTSSPPT